VAEYSDGSPIVAVKPALYETGVMGDR
jgi:hypothetical protein